jgi:hypothetical protein
VYEKGDVKISVPYHGSAEMSDIIEKFKKIVGWP